MFETPMKTTPCSRFDMTATYQGIKRLEIDSALVPATGALSDIRLVPPGVEGFQPFRQPITKLDYPNLNVPVVVDGRSILRVDKTPLKLDVYNHFVLYARLTELWYTKGRSMQVDLLNLGQFPAKIFASWLSGAVQRLDLDLGQITQFRILASVYYIQLYTPLSEHPTHDEVERILARVSKLLPAIDIYTLENFFDGKIPRLNNIFDFVKWVVEKLDTPRLEKLTPDFFYTALGFNFGPEFREQVAVALEYPPAFLSMVNTACTERTYQKSGLGRIIETLIKKQDDKEFVKNLKQITGK